MLLYEDTGQSESKPTIWSLQLLILKPRSQGAITVNKFPIGAALQVPQNLSFALLEDKREIKY